MARVSITAGLERTSAPITLGLAAELLMAVLGSWTSIPALKVCLQLDILFGPIYDVILRLRGYGLYLHLSQ